MKVGEYVRTIKGIGKIEKIETDKQDTIVYLDSGITIDYITKDFTEEEINKMYPSSFNITDLIEVGDYVNGSYVEGFIEKNKFQNKLIITEAGMIDNNDIKSIVTKEAYAGVEYRVETD